jgi:DNA primase
LRFCFLPEGEDPDTFISTKGRAEFDNFINRSLSLTDFLWTHHTSGKNFSAPELRAGLQKTLDDIAGQIQDGSVQYHVKQEFRDKARALFRPFQNNYSGSFKKGGKPQTIVNLTLPAVRQKQDLIPQILLAILINHPWLYHEVEDQFFELYPDQHDLRAVHDQILSFFTTMETHTLDNQALLLHLECVGLADIAKTITSSNVMIHAGCARPDATPEKVREGFKGFWAEWEKSKFAHDLTEARQALKLVMTLENEQKLANLISQNDRNHLGDEGF